MSGSTFGVLVRVERRPYAVFALLARCKNSFGKASANFDVVGALSGGGDGTGMDSVVDIVLLGIGGSRRLAIRSRGGQVNQSVPTLVTDHRKFNTGNF